MEIIVVERTLEDPVDMGALADGGERLRACLHAHNARFIQSYMAADGKRMICVYEAPDAESVRIALRQHGMLPFDRAWKANLWRAQDIAALAETRAAQGN